MWKTRNATDVDFMFGQSQISYFQSNLCEASLAIKFNEQMDEWYWYSHKNLIKISVSNFSFKVWSIFYTPSEVLDYHEFKSVDSNI